MIYNRILNHQALDPKSFGKVAVLLGGHSAEREVSLASGEQVFTALCQAGVDCLKIDPVDRLVEQLHKHQPDRVFNALHGRGGEDGLVQGLLETLGIPYTGSGVMASALAMDKYRSKLLWQSVGLSTPDFRLIQNSENLDLCVEILPVFVKPSQEGSSVGIRRVNRESDLLPAWEHAQVHCPEVLVEQFVDGPEYTVTILNGQALPAIRIESVDEFYDYEAKYLSNDTQYHIPCGLPTSKEQELQAMALTAFEVLGCSGWGRVDIMEDALGELWVLEVNTVPGMTDHSLVPMAAETAGLAFDELVLEILISSIAVDTNPGNTNTSDTNAGNRNDVSDADKTKDYRGC